MNKHLSFLLILGVAGFAVGCPGPDPVDDGGVCPTGMICLDGAMPDGGDLPDGGPPPDTGPPAMCGTTGQMAGSCRRGQCITGLECGVQWGPTIPFGMPQPQSTIGEAFGYNSGTPAAGREGEYESTGTTSDIPVNFAPGGGQCTQACNFASGGGDDGCGTCSTCSNALGGGPAVSQFGAQGLAYTDMGMPISDRDTYDGICRLNCAFDPASTGGCPDGYTCDMGTNICIEACASDAQCNANFGLSESDTFVVYETGDGAVCNATTGRCETTRPPDATLQTECDSNLDCPEFGFCAIGGRCLTYQCADAEGMVPGLVDCASECIGLGGNNGSVCVQGCMAPSDCFPGQACSPTSMPFPSGAVGYCIGVCDTDAECRSEERCEEVRPATATSDSLSVCSTVCDPDPADGMDVPNAVACETDEACLQAGTAVHGFCKAINQLCFNDDGCNAGQACQVSDANLMGRCVDGCRAATAATDCASGEECVVFDDSDATTNPDNNGVCRAPDGACAATPRNTAMEARQPLLGDAQCVSTQECSQTMATTPATTGTCVDR